MLTGPKFSPASGKPPRQLVVFLHGLGADGDDLIGLAASWAQNLPDAVFHSPHAPEACDMAPFGYQWFSLRVFEPAAMYAGAQAAAETLNDAIDGWLDQYNLTDKDLALVGFSQGGMMALHVGLRRSKPCAAIIGYSGCLIAPERLRSEIVSKPPCLLIHGALDTVVPYMMLEMSRGALSDAGVPVRTETRPMLGHGIDPEGMQMGLDFLCRNMK